MKHLFLSLVALLFVMPALGAIRLPGLFADHMVLQRKQDAAIWGTAEPGEKVQITGSWNGRSVKVTANARGEWKTFVKTGEAGGPYSLVIRGDRDGDSLHIGDVWLGEVWLCSGQSNMTFPLAKQQSWRTGVYNYEQEVAGAQDSLIRMFTVGQRPEALPQAELKGSWEPCSPATAGNFSAVAYYFARELRRKTGLPVGIIHSSVGGTPAEAWVGRSVLLSDTAFDALAMQMDTVRKINSKLPTVLYNGMIHPVAPYTIRGFVWYQGESNSDRFMQYRKLFPALIRSWRAEWGGELPFYFVQIAPQYSKVPGIREAQLMTYRTVPNTGMVVVTDAGDSLDIHPRNKAIVGQRLALWALAREYGQNGLVYSGPLYRKFSVEGSRIRVYFDFAGTGLEARDGALREFTIAGADGVFHEASAVVEGDAVVVSSEEVSKPVAVRFAWKNFFHANLFNKAGLPASPFRTDDW